MPTGLWPITVSQQRIRWGAVPGHPSIRLRHQWGAVHNYTEPRTCTSPATRVFIHISVTNPSSYRGNDAHAQAIERIGRARFGTSRFNTGISYNFGVMPNAALYEFQPAGRRGAHTVNDYRISRCTRSGPGCPGRNQALIATDSSGWNLNYNARAFVICQNVDDPVTDDMIDTLARAIVCSYEAGLITRHAAHHPHGHRCVSGKSCPGERMWKRMGDLHTRIHHYLDHGLTTDQEVDMSQFGPENWDTADHRAARMVLFGEDHYLRYVMMGEKYNLGFQLRDTRAWAIKNGEGLAHVLANQKAIMSAQGVEVDEAELGREIAAVLVPAVIAALPDTGLTEGELEDTVEQVVRGVFGSLDNEADETE